MRSPTLLPVSRSLFLFSSISCSHAVVAPLAARDLAAPIIGDGTSWEYIGCYIDIGRTISDAVTSSATMTNEECVAFCEGEGYPYAGTQWYGECYCGRTLAEGAGPAASEAECNTPCNGDPQQPCGGGSRLTLYHALIPVGPQEISASGDWQSIGCWTEGQGARALPYAAAVDSSTMTIETCVSACQAAGYILAGAEYGGECHCGNDFQANAGPASSGCGIACNGDATQLCGGPDRLNVYDYQGQWSATGSPDRSAPASGAPTDSAGGGASPSGPGHPAIVGSFTFQGCLTDNAGGTRALQGALYGGADVDLDFCASYCSAYTYFGTEYAGECWCGNTIMGPNTMTDEAECNMLCNGNQLQYCGAGNRLSLYAKDGSGVPDPPPTTAAPTTAATDIVVPTGLPVGWDYYGCYIDGVNGRILSHQEPDSDTLTNAACAQACAGLGYKISGTQFFSQCFCGNQLANIQEGSDPVAPNSDCSTACSGDSSEMCGGPNRLSIYSSGQPVIYEAPKPQVSGLNETWQYMGCAIDNINDERTFRWKLHRPQTLTATECLSTCATFGYAAAGLQYGEECYCGDPANMDTVGSTFVANEAEECNIVCTGDPRYICGGLSRLTTYFWNGTEPLYEWDFPTGPDAGEYSLLLGGVVIPLMTMESITGKVSFLEKFGTGPPNSTGAYELDLSLVNEFDRAWREMHVRTDLFCSGGVVLPDKAGRQLTVGGWSGDSTFGVRLYAPDGSPGVNGTNDWEENVNVLSLQDGRWYPTVMTMANGSVLVIGGEDGPNGAAVPTLEILPKVGPSLFMEWLERTDPNNLYPFTAVMPNGGIFVAYWNEARIIDEVTFEDQKILPNMPGAVNDPLGGRTYPLEGTAVLLPQYGPDYGNLGILLCGGSTVGVSNALDNCVHTYPEDPEPEWIIERMPSIRVMSCMAPLPDGTYLILNGAHHGVAGFGLAEDPNYNAVLYDPAKPAHKRMSVMANTTVPRMYHSEAITLLDGRVLVSGSDPQDGVNPQEYRVEVFTPPYLLNGGPRPTFTVSSKDWAYGATISFTLGAPAPGGAAIMASLLGAVSSTHGNSMGTRTMIPQLNCPSGSATCTFAAPPDAHKCPPGWYQFFVLQNGVPAVGVYVRIGGDPAGLGNWPEGADFTRPGLGPVE